MCERERHVFVLNGYALRRRESAWSEAHTGFYSALAELSADLLRRLCRNRDNSDADIVFLAEIRKTVKRQYRLFAFAVRRNLRVERRENVKPVVGKTAVVEQRSAELSRADYDRLSVAAVYEAAEAFLEVGYGVSYPRLARAAYRYEPEPRRSPAPLLLRLPKRFRCPAAGSREI